MDPTTTLVTFMLQTHPSVTSVRLIGSWDNFNTSYRMDRDSRRDRGQWKGCYAFKDITCDDDFGVGPSRDGGLKMGNTYYYYYELDNSHETHDPACPSTTHCPYLPGQAVNTLFVPVQQTLRKRSASLSSMRNGDFMTMNPRDKYITPRATPVAPPTVPSIRLGSSPHILRNRSSSRSLSPNPSWKRFFRRSARDEQDSAALAPETETETEERIVRSTTPGSGSRSRDISPDSLRRFLCDDTIPLSPIEDGRPSVLIPEDIAEELDDDDNFATSATSEHSTFTTGLAPPPFKRTVSSDTITLAANPYAAPPRTAPAALQSPTQSIPESPVIPEFEHPALRSRFSFSSISSYASSVGAEPEAETPPVYDVLDELDLQSHGPRAPLPDVPVSKRSLGRQYSLPGTAESSKDGLQTAPALIAEPFAGGAVDDLVAELGWMAAVIGKHS